MSLVITPPLVSIPRLSGVTSSSRTSFTSPLSTPAWRAAPTATTSSGLTPLLGSLPPVISLTRSDTAGIRVEPLTGAVQQIQSDLLELGAGQLLVEEQRVLVRVDGDVGQVDRGALARAQLDLGLLGRLAQPLHGHLVLGQVNAAGALELFDQPVNDALVPVVATEVFVTAGSTDLDHTLADLEQRDVEGAAAEVEDQDGLFLLALVQAVGQRSRSGLVDDAQH